ncbi:MAG: DIP1984 family protein [Muribaculaceae bacterium]
MKLAEALSLRADLQTRIAAMKTRLKESAKVQEGDTPPENLAELRRELDAMLSQLEKLIYRINLTNLHATDGGESLTAMIARKDVLRMRVGVMREVINFVSESDSRYSRAEIKTVRIMDVPEARRELDRYSKELRELDMRLQGLNWTIDLIEE